jgi:RNA polymerase sigma factor (sigma-70 family)
MSQTADNKLHFLYESHSRELVAFVRQRVGSTDASDVVQDTYLRVLQYANQDALENPRAYLYRVASNVSADQGVAIKERNERIDQDVDPDELHATTENPETITDARQRLMRCLAAMDELPAEYRHVFLLHRIDGLTQGEISDSLNIPKRTVERYIAKTLEHCLKRLAQENI